MGEQMNESRRLRVLLADDQPLLRMGFRLILEGEDGLEVVGEASDGADAVRQVGHLDPDVVLMDVRMPTLDGIEATRAITSSGSRARIIIPDHLRPGRVRLRRAPGRGLGLLAEGCGTGRTGPGRPGGGERGCRCGPKGHAAAS
jgi:hypothetical protein